MKYILLLMLVMSPITALASTSKVPFELAESYSIVSHSINKSDDDGIFVNTYSRDGLKTRNENAKDGILILRLDTHQKIAIKDGKVVETTLPAGWPLSTIFPKNAPWEPLGRDMLNGKLAQKYKITRDPSTTDFSMHAAYVTVWLSEDNKVPLRMEDGDMVLEYSDYKPGPLDAKLFEAPAK